MIGGALATSLKRDGHELVRLVRRPARKPDEVEWHPERDEVDPAVVSGVDVVVCLSGAPIGPKLLLSSYRRTVLDSRVQSAATLAHAIAAAGEPPRAYVVASAVGYYGDTGDRIVDESSGPGVTFLSDVCVQWEAAAAPAAEAGVRVTHLRTGLPLSSDGGLLAALRPIVKLGLGGRIGSGRQFMPWISMTDEIGAIRKVMADDDLSGPVDLTGPEPARNQDFVQTLARLLHRPAVVPVPAWPLKLVLRDLAPDFLGGQRAIPKRLLAAGFEFTYPTLEAALQSAL